MILRHGFWIDQIAAAAISGSLAELWWQPELGAGTRTRLRLDVVQPTTQLRLMPESRKYDL